MPRTGIPKREPIVATNSQVLLLGAFLAAVMVLVAAAEELQIARSWLIVLGVLGFGLTMVLLFAVDRRHDQLQELASTDALTGLVNHGGFHEALAEELGRAKRDGTTVALVAIDLDDFKPINDAHGHPYGDRVLREIGTALLAAGRATDTAARVGGEEFALILPGVGGDRAYAIAERARETIAAIPADGFKLSCSAGVAVFPTDANDAATLCQLADSSLYWAKRAGKGRTRRFDPGHGPIHWSDRQDEQVSELLALDEPVVAVFQPVVSLVTGLLVGYEALARFPTSPGRSPAVWFAQAHGCGRGAELEAIAVRAALNPPGRLPGTSLSINLSPSALSSELVQAALPRDLTDLVIEITEHEFIPDDEELASALADLRLRGALIAIDDAGAGHAGLKQLMRVRPDIVKLDRALTHGIHADPVRIALAESFVRFARDVGATVCAEGIETLDDLAVLADLDVEWGQGYVLARPSPPWAEVSKVAAGVCRGALAEAYRTTPEERHQTGSSDRRLVHLSASLAGARSREELMGTLELIGTELSASKVSLSRVLPDQEVLETLAETLPFEGPTRFAIDQYPLTAAVMREQVTVQVSVGDPEADAAEIELLLELGERALLMVPVVCRGETLGLLEVYRTSERPWARADINRARVIANQFASLIQALFPVRG